MMKVLKSSSKNSLKDRRNINVFAKTRMEFYGLNLCIVAPKNHELRKQIFDAAHLSKFSIHTGRSKMYQDIWQNFWWTKMKREIAKYFSECDTCQRVKASHSKVAGTLQPLPKPSWK
jgi:hypothetical protein